MTQLHFQLCTIRTLPIAFLPGARCLLSFPKFHGGSLRQQLASQHLTAFPIQSTSDPAHCPYFSPSLPQPSPVRVRRRSAAARATVWCPSGRRMPGGWRRPWFSHLRAHAASHRRSAVLEAAAGGGRMHGRAPPRPAGYPAALSAASPAASPRGRPRASPRLPTGAARPAHARRAAGRAGHTPPTHSVSLSLPALAPSPSGVSQSLPVAAGDFSASPFLPSPRRSLGLSREGAAERERD